VSLDAILWFAGEISLAAVTALLLYRRLWRTLPLFISYIAWELIGSAVSQIFREKSSSYVTWYLAETIVDSVLLFGVLVELAWSILRPVRASLSRAALIPVVGLILAVGAVIWPFASLSGLAGTSARTHFIVQLQQTVSILQVIFFLALIAGSQLLSIGWRDRELQVATGLGFFSLVGITAALLHTHQSSLAQYRHLYQAVIGGYICSLVYWIVCFAQKEAARREFTPQMQSALLAVAGAARTTRVALTDSGVGKARKQ